MRCFALIALLTSWAWADGVRKETLVVGQTIEREVGYAIGAQCDEDVVSVEMKSKNPETNVAVFTAKREGKTRCRVGTDPNRVSHVFEITVRPKKRRG